jgi:CBS domain containing-hemolysin-like protein
MTANQTMMQRTDRLPVPVLKREFGKAVAGRQAGRWLAVGLTAALLAGLPTNAHASIFQGEALDKFANVLAWVVLIVAPAVGIAVFWIVHILPEKIAEKRRHPQAKAIQCLCLLSLAFGGLLWPLAWLWAYSKPVLHKLAYGTDVDEELVHEKQELKTTEKEVEQLRRRLAELEAKLPGKSTAAEGKA